MPPERTFTELMQESARTAFSAVNPVGGFFLQSPEISAGLFGERESVVTPGVFQTERGPDRYQDSPYAQMVRQQGIQARSLAGPDRPMTENEKLRLGLNMMKSLDQKRLYESLEPDPARRTAIALERAKSDRVLGDPNASPEDREEAELWRAWESKQIADIEKVLHEYEGKLFTDTYDYHQKAADAARKGYTPQQVANSLALSGFGKKIVTPAEWDRLEAERQLLTLNGELGKANAIALTRNAMLRSADPRSWKDANLTPVDLAIEESGRILAEDDSFQNWLKIRGANTFVASMRAIQRLAGSGEFDAQDVDALEAAVTAMGDPDLLTRSALKKVNLENLDQEDVWRSRYGNPSWHAAVGGFMGDLYGGFHDPIFNVVFMGLAKLPMSVPVHRAQAQISGRLVPGLTTRGAIARQLEAQGMSRLQAGMTARSATLEDVAVMGLSNWFRRRRVSKALSDYAGNLLFNIADASVSNAFATGLESRSYGRDWSEVLADAGSGAVEGAMMGALFHNGLVLGGTAVARSLDHLPRDVRPAIANAMEYVRLSPNRVKAGMVQNELERMVAQASVDFMREAGVDSLSSTQARRLLRTLGIDAGEWRNLKVEGSDWRPGEPPARIRAEAGMPVEPQQVVVNLRRRADELGDTDAGEAMAAAADRIEELSLESELPPQSGRDQGIHGIGDVSYHVLPDGRTVAVRYDTSGRPMTRRTYSRIYEATTKERATTAEMIAEEYGDRKAEDLLMRRKSPEEARKIGASAARDARSIEDLEEATPLLQAMQESEGDVKFRKEQLQDMHAELYSEVAAIQDLLLSEDPAVAVDAAQRLAGLGIRMNQLDEEIANRFGSDALRDTWQRSGEQVAPNFDLAQMVRKPEATGPIRLEEGSNESIVGQTIANIESAVAHGDMTELEAEVLRERLRNLTPETIDTILGQFGGKYRSVYEVPIADLLARIKRAQERGVEFRNPFEELMSRQAQMVRPDRIPAESRVASEAGVPATTSEIKAPPRAQAEPSQVSATKPPPSVQTTREILPSETEGPAKTVPGRVGTLDPSTNRKVLQEATEVDVLIEQAGKYQTELQSVLDELAEDIPDIGVRPAPEEGLPEIGTRHVPKKKGRVMEKVALGKPPETIGDYMSGRIALGRLSAADDVVKGFEKRGWEVIDDEDFLEGKSIKGGYRARHIQVLHPDRQFSMEVQLVPHEVAQVQQIVHDNQFVELRSYDVPPGEEMSPQAAQRVKELRDEMTAMYSDAWERFSVRSAEAENPAKIMAKLGELPEDHPAYFNITEDAEIIDIHALRPVRARPKGLRNANRFMREAFEGRADKRKPISVRLESDGTYTVLDGNSTYANALHSGWSSLPAIVETAEGVAKARTEPPATQPQVVPETVERRVREAVEGLQAVKQKMAQLRKAPFAQNEWMRENAARIVRDKNTLENFRVLARKNGIDPEPVIERLGGELDLEELAQIYQMDPDSLPYRKVTSGRQPDQPMPEPSGSVRRVDGAETEVVLADGSSRTGRYAVVEADQLLTSHVPETGFQKRQGADINERPYDDPVAGRSSRETVWKIAENFNARLAHSDTPSAIDGPPVVNENSVVLGGNARGMGQQLAYIRGNGAVIREAVIRDAPKFGLSPGEVSSMRQPVIVRVIDDAGEPGQLSRILNEALTTARTAEVDAVSRGRKVSPTTVELVAGLMGDDTLSVVLNSPSMSAKVVRSLVQDGALTEADVVRMRLADGRLNPQGRQIIEQALLGTVISDSAVLTRATPSARQKVLRSLPHLLALKRGGEEFDLSESLTMALDAHADFKASGLTMEDYLDQGTLMGRPWDNDSLALSLAWAIEHDTPTAFARKLKVIREFSNDQIVGQTGLDFMGERSFEDVLWEVFERKDGPKIDTPLGSVTMYSNPVLPFLRVAANGLRMTEDALNAAGRWFFSNTTGRGSRWMAARLAGTRLEGVGTALTDAVVKQFAPIYRAPVEAAALIRQARGQSALGRKVAQEWLKVLHRGGTSDFLGIELDRRLMTADNRRMAGEVLRGELDIGQLPAELQAAVSRVRAIFTNLGEQAVRSGLLPREVFERNRDTYLPRLYLPREMESLGLFGLGGKYKKILDRFKIKKDAYMVFAGDRPISDASGSYKFDTPEARDAFFESMVEQITAKELNLDLADITNPVVRAAFPDKLQLAIDSHMNRVRKRYSKVDPFTEEQLTRMGVIREPAFPVAKGLAQLNHDITMANLFNELSSRLDWVADQPTPGFTQMPVNKRYGKLSGKYVLDAIQKEIVGLSEAPGMALSIYDELLRYFKVFKTVYNPATHGRNLMGNLFFAHLSGTTPLSPANQGTFLDALKIAVGKGTIRIGARDMQPHEILRELIATRTIGTDFARQELRGVLAELDVNQVISDSPMAMFRKIRELLWSPKAGKDIWTMAYRAEDDWFKVAAYLAERKRGASPSEAASHVRRWFPFYDELTGPGARLARRTVKPFASFYLESLRIGMNGLKEKPFTMLKLMSLPSLMSAYGAYKLGLTEEEVESIKKDVHGTGPFRKGANIILPVRDEQGRVQVWDLNNVIPYADLIGSRVEVRGEGEGEQADPLRKFFLSLMLSNPVSNIAAGFYSGQNPFFGKDYTHTGMSTIEKTWEHLKFAGQSLLPPLTPGFGNAWRAIVDDSVPKGTLQPRNMAQQRIRSLGGVDVRSGMPNLYRLVDEYMVVNELPPRPRPSGDTTPRSRARARLYQSVLDSDQDEFNRTQQELDDLGVPTRTWSALKENLSDRHPLRRLRKAHWKRFMSQLLPIERESVQMTLDEYDAAKKRARDMLKTYREQAGE